METTFYSWVFSLFFFLKSSAALLIQYLKPVGLGPSSKTCPRWPSHLEHRISILCLERLLSLYSETETESTGVQELGHPEPESYLVSELNKGAAHPAQL